jgi:serine/threonine protein kinase
VDSNDTRQSDQPSERLAGTSPNPTKPLGRIRDYDLIRMIGQGGMGTVYLGVHRIMKREVAIKVLPTARMSDAESISRFHREVQAVARLHHPNIVQAHDAGEENGTVHRDIKPSNLLVMVESRGLRVESQDGSKDSSVSPHSTLNSRPLVKILDLGLALLNEADRAMSQYLTSTGQIMGTLDYMAPEQADDTHAVDIRADIYSLGCTLYVLLAGEPPFGGPQFTTAVKKLAAHMQKPVPALSDKRNDVPTELVAILDRMLAKEPHDRFATPGEVAAALQPFVEDANLPQLLERATAAKPATKPVKTSLHETQGQASSALTATRPSQVPARLDTTQDHSPADATLASSPAARRRSLTPRVLIALAVTLLLALCGVIIIQIKDKSGKVVDTIEVPAGGSFEVTQGDTPPPTLNPQPSTLNIPEPPPLEEWLQGREILTVKQDGTAMFTKIQDALDALKPGQVVEVLDKGPYMENLKCTLPAEAGLISRAGGQVALAGPPTSDGADLAVGHQFNVGNNCRLSGVTFFADDVNAGAESTVRIFTKGNLVVEDCNFLTQTVADDRWTERSLTLVPMTQDLAELVIRHNCIVGRLEFNAVTRFQAIRIHRNFVGGSPKGPLAISGVPRSIVVDENIVQTGFYGSNLHASAIHIQRAEGTASPRTSIDAQFTRNTISAPKGILHFAGWDHQFRLAATSNLLICRVISEQPEVNTVMAASENTVLQVNVSLGSSGSKAAGVSLDLNDSMCYRPIVATPAATSIHGALPPGPAPPEGDWFTRLQERWQEAEEDLKRRALTESPESSDRSPEPDR